MSSGDDTKPTVNPPVGREDNPFDITKRPQHEVAAEIASRLASWKQARNRSSSTATQTTDANRTVDAGRSDAEQSPLAPVQPQVPKPSGYEAHHIVNAPPQPATATEPPQPAEPAPAPARSRSSVDGEPLAPFAMRRAMPPAPSPRRPEAAEPPVTARAQRPTGDSAATTARADAPERVPASEAKSEPRVAPTGTRAPSRHRRRLRISESSRNCWRPEQRRPASSPGSRCLEQGLQVLRRQVRSRHGPRCSAPKENGSKENGLSPRSAPPQGRPRATRVAPSRPWRSRCRRATIRGCPG
jgi:hypothetical protein